jgi:SagB-type dehydrogenase family enzyme
MTSKTTDSHGIIRESRSAPSAGGIHEIDTYLVSPDTQVVERYDSLCHALDKLVVADETCIDRFLNDVRAASPAARGTVMAFIADTESIGGVYANSASLLWRDAGCVLATMHLCAEALGLAFLPLGLLGENMIAGLGMPAARFSAVGAAVAGRRVSAG